MSFNTYKFAGYGDRDHVSVPHRSHGDGSPPERAGDRGELYQQHTHGDGVVVVYQCTIINVMVLLGILKLFCRARFTLC